MALTKIPGELINIDDLDLTNVGTLHLDSIVSDASPAVITIGHGSNDKLRIDGTVGLGTDAHDTQALHILSSARHLRLENAGSPGEIALIGVIDDGILDIWAHGDNSSDAITFRTGSSTGTERVRIANDGKLLMGHNANVGQAGVAPTLQVHGTGSATSSISATRNSNDTGGPYLILSKSRGTSTGATTVVQANDILGQIMFAGADGGDLAPVGASIQAFVDTTPGTNDMPGRLVFSTTVDGAQAATERMRIQNSGITQFKTGDGNSGIAEFHTNASSGNTTGYISIRPQGTAVGYLGNGSPLLSGADDSDLILRSEGSLILNSNGNNERLRVRSDGNVGIGSVGMPSNTSYRQLSIGPMAHIMAEVSSGTGKSLHISQNAHLDTDSSWETMETDEASNYYQHAGKHVFRRAASTSAGTDITWSTTLELFEDGAVGLGPSWNGTKDSSLKVMGDQSGWLSVYHNDGNNSNRYGIKIGCGADNQAGTNYAMGFDNGNFTVNQGYITWTSGTVTYGAFTAHHPCIIPDSDNDPDSSENAYPYGTLLETVSLSYTQSEGADTERGIRYSVQKSSGAYSKKVLGAYGSSMNNAPHNPDNEHQALVLGDGHILCNNEKGNISVGDGICTSTTAGIGMKADKMAMIIGIAQEDVTFSGSETKLVAVQYGLQQFTPWTD